MVDYAELIKRLVPMQDVAERYTGEPIRFNRMRCPIHHGKDRNLRIYPKSYYCWVCHAHGDVIQFVMSVMGLSFQDAMRRINDDFGLGLPIGAEPSDAERQIVESNKTFAECVKFFSSDKYRDMTTVSGEIVLDAAIKQGKYLVWKHDRGCSRCKYAKNKQCKHGKGGAANWYAWDKGDRNCLWYQSKKAIAKRANTEGGDAN